MKEILSVIWYIGKIPFEGIMIYRISEIFEKIARKGSLPWFAQNDIIHSIYDNVDDITRIILFSFMLIYYYKKWTCSDKNYWSNVKEESIKYAYIGVPVLSILAGIIDRIVLWAVPMIGLSGRIDPDANTIMRPVETCILAFVCLAFMQFRYSIFRWLKKDDWIGHFIFFVVYILLNIILHCISYGLFHLVFTFILNAFLMIIILSVLCPGLLWVIMMIWPADV